MTPETFTALCAEHRAAPQVTDRGNTPTTCSTKTGWRTDDHK